MKEMTTPLITRAIAVARRIDRLATAVAAARKRTGGPRLGSRVAAARVPKLLPAATRLAPVRRRAEPPPRSSGEGRDIFVVREAAEPPAAIAVARASAPEFESEQPLVAVQSVEETAEARDSGVPPAGDSSARSGAGSPALLRSVPEPPPPGLPEDMHYLWDVWQREKPGGRGVLERSRGARILEGAVSEGDAVARVEPEPPSLKRAAHEPATGRSPADAVRPPQGAMRISRTPAQPPPVTPAPESERAVAPERGVAPESGAPLERAAASERVAPVQAATVAEPAAVLQRAASSEPVAVRARATDTETVTAPEPATPPERVVAPPLATPPERVVAPPRATPPEPVAAPERPRILDRSPVPVRRIERAPANRTAGTVPAPVVSRAKAEPKPDRASTPSRPERPSVLPAPRPEPTTIATVPPPAEPPSPTAPEPAPEARTPLLSRIFRRAPRPDARQAPPATAPAPPEAVPRQPRPSEPPPSAPAPTRPVARVSRRSAQPATAESLSRKLDQPDLPDSAIPGSNWGVAAASEARAAASNVGVPTNLTLPTTAPAVGGHHIPRTTAPPPAHDSANSTGAAIHAGGGDGDSDHIYGELLRRLREEQEQLSQIVDEPF